MMVEVMTPTIEVMGYLALRFDLAAHGHFLVWLGLGARKIPSPNAALGDGFVAARQTPPKQRYTHGGHL